MWWIMQANNSVIQFFLNRTSVNLKESPLYNDALWLWWSKASCLSIEQHRSARMRFILLLFVCLSSFNHAQGKKEISFIFFFSSWVYIVNLSQAMFVRWGGHSLVTRETVTNLFQPGLHGPGPCAPVSLQPPTHPWTWSPFLTKQRMTSFPPKSSSPAGGPRSGQEATGSQVSGSGWMGAGGQDTKTGVLATLQEGQRTNWSLLAAVEGEWGGMMAETGTGGVLSVSTLQKLQVKKYI